MALLRMKLPRDNKDSNRKYVYCDSNDLKRYAKELGNLNEKELRSFNRSIDRAVIRQKFKFFFEDVIFIFDELIEIFAKYS